MNELDQIKKRKLEELKKRYMDRGNIMNQDTPNKPVDVSDADIDKMIEKYSFLVVDCWAPWCGPCRMVGPVIEDLAKEMQGKIVFGKLNVDENRNTSMRYQIMSIPTLLIFKDGNLANKLIGAMPKEELKARLEPYL